MTAAEVEMRGRIRERDAEEEAEATMTATTETETPAVKRRKLEEDVDEGSREVYSPYVRVQLTNMGEIVARDLAEAPDSTAGDQCQSPSVSVSYCSSNGFSQKLNGRIGFPYLLEEHSSSSSRSETSLYREQQEESESMDSASPAGESQPSDAAESRTVTEAELEDFFMSAEKDLRKKIFDGCTRYNFDFVKEDALDGRFEWVKLKP